MANISLPHNFEDRLREDQRLLGIVYTTISNYGEILKENKLYFFEEYTDHGIDHIESVLRGSERLITEETSKYILSVEDIGYYILSVVLHDLGMHLNYEGFQVLLSGQYNSVRVKELDTTDWPELWQEYLIEAKRFNGKQLIELFGNDKIFISDPSKKNKSELNGNDKKLIGEFIRRYHPRIAHEIALKGMPGTNILEFANGLDDNRKNLVGLVARSHGMNLRPCIDYIIEIYGAESKRNAFGTHWPFLMILLRISDYLQIEKSRSLFNLVLKLKTFESPTSKLEHELHQSIENIENRYQDDPEKIFVYANPKDSRMYLKIKKLIESIQYEFDISWAVLGELYGNSKEKPEIKYRRITSNLSKSDLEKRLEYIPGEFSFKANEDIVKLLIAPLYGKNPKYGIRELLQNAVDACNEKVILESVDSEFNPLITIKLIYEKGENFFEIRDNGKGMSIDEIKNYFLNAGASYRSSLDWKKKFVDEKGNSKVNRSGRFGIGVLASFLIGEEVLVETRKKGSDFGLSFTTTLNNNQINITKSVEILEGTLVRVKTSDEVVKYLESSLDSDDYTAEINWMDWYVMENPKIEYSLLGNKAKRIKNFLPHFTNLDKNWQALYSNGYEKILWSYNKNFENYQLICNGFVIPLSDQEKFINLGLISKPPCIHVFDNNGILPLSLDRKQLTEPVSFALDLKEDLYKDIIARLLTLKKYSYVEGDKIKIVSQNLNYPGYGETNSPDYHSYGTGNYYNFDGENRFLNGQPYNRSFLDQILISKQGYILNYNYFIQRVSPAKYILMQSDSTSVKTISLDLQDNFFIFSDKKLSSIEDYKSAIHGDTINIISNQFDKHNTRVFIKLDKYHYLFNSQNKRVPDWLKEVATPESEYKDWVKLKLDNPKDSLIDDKFLNKYKNDLNFIRESQLFCLNEGDKLFNTLLNKYLGNNIIIPYSIEERRQKFPTAFQELKQYMEKYL